MRADKVLEAILTKNGLTPTEASRLCGRSDEYLRVVLGRRTSPKIDTMADLCDYLEWDVLVRDRSDGYEILIDPPD